ncbi:unnamed protein product, partial [Didymodactylos carnosus]
DSLDHGLASDGETTVLSYDKGTDSSTSDNESTASTYDGKSLLDDKSSDEFESENEDQQNENDLYFDQLLSELSEQVTYEE